MVFRFMSSWLVILIVSVGWFLLFLAVLSGVVIKCSYMVTRAKAREQYWQDKANELQKIINAYGMREMHIGRDK